MLNPALKFNKTRIAPTPSGYLHLGNAMSFALTASLAQQTGAKILLRIDDLDRNRVSNEYVQDIFGTLSFLQIPYDEGPRNFKEYKGEWSQVHRLPLYKKALRQLREKGQVFACSCSRTQINNCTCKDNVISLDAEHVSWRLLTNLKKELTIQTLEAGEIKTVLPTSMNEFVVRKKDGYPAYQLTSLIDDVHFSIDLVVRGEDLWDSTVAQYYLASILDEVAFQKITFHHHQLVMETGGAKLSKSAGATAITYLREIGMTAAEVYKKIGTLAC